MRSMTGFGAATHAEPTVPLRVEIRSVNHRHLQVKTKLPGDLQFLESDIEELVRGRIDRGAVSVSVTFSSPTAMNAVTVNTDTAKRYKKLLTGLAKDLGLAPDLGLDTLAGLPGVIGGDVDKRSMQQVPRAVRAVVTEALDALGRMRDREGAAMLRDLQKNAKLIGKVVARIAKRMPRVVKQHQKTLHARVQDLLGGNTTIQAQDLAREVALIADRMDVSEELTRLDSHLVELARLLAKDGAVGRRLDFLVQELHREANTIGSKTNDLDLSRTVLDLRAAIERLREQVQNLE